MAFDDLSDDGVEGFDGFDWPDKSPKGPAKDSAANIRHFFQVTGRSLSWNAFNNKIYVRHDDSRTELTEQRNQQLRAYAEANGFHCSSDFWFRHVSVLALEQQWHPLRDELARLQAMWDGIPRLDTLLITYLGAADTPLNRAIGRLMVVAAVRRVRVPGCKYDFLVVLIGPQGGGKSTVIRVLAGPDYYTDALTVSLNPKEIIETTVDRWFCEFSELQGMKRADVEHVKAMLSRSEDVARLAYARQATRVPRQWIGVATVNDGRFLRDVTGNRRFLPVHVGKIDLDRLARDRDQIIAEAAVIESQGHPLELPRDLWGAAAEQQAACLITDPWSEIIEPWIADRTGWTPTSEIWAKLGVETARQDQNNGTRLHGVMRTLGFVRKQRRASGRLAWGWIRQEEAADE